MRSVTPKPENLAQLVFFVRGEKVMLDADLARKIEAMENKYDEQFAVVFDAIKQLIAEDQTRKACLRRRIGFLP